jgi:class 3 adenylate cyclase
MNRYLVSMASLSAVDLVITGIFIVLSGHTAVVFEDIAANLVILGLLNTAIGVWLFRPIRDYFLDRRDPKAAMRRLQRLPAWSAVSAALVTLLYCGVAFQIGVFTPDSQAIAAVPLVTRVLAFAWFAFAYTVFYAFYTYFLISDVAATLRRKPDSEGSFIRASGGRIVHKLIVVFCVVAIVPNLLIVADLTVFSGLRAAQGLSVSQTIFLDLFASVFLVGVSLIFVTRSLTRPVNQLMSTMRRVRDGDLAVRAPVVTDDELGVLAASFNAMIGAVEERAFIRDTFGRYVPDSVAAALVAKRGQLEPVLTTATILYTDIADFTRIAETMAPARLVDMLNEYFSAVIKPITCYGGVVSQFQGDAMLVTFNVPVDDPDHADHAVAAAVEMLDIVAGRTFADVELRVRVGINTGEVIAGPVGSGDRVSYTVYGDAVNSAARLEQLCKEFGVRALVSEATVKRLVRSYPLETIGEVPIRGKAQALTVYKLAA